MRYTGLFLSLLLLSLAGQAQMYDYYYSDTERPTTRILFVMDCSQSMAGSWDDHTKIDIARRFLISTIDSLEKIPKVEMALRVYGHQSIVPPQDCNDTRLEVPFAANNVGRIRQKLRSLHPKGTTPIANSLSHAGDDFPDCPACRNVIILITDGIEACDGDPCAVSRELQKKGIILKPFIIGVGLDEQFMKTFECVGNVYNAADENRFQEVLQIVISQALNETTAQVNLLDAWGMPSETNVNMTFMDQYTGKIKYNYIHTMNHRGEPDTIRLDPLQQYRLKVHTIPPVFKDSIELATGKHNIISVDAPQGNLLVKTAKGYQYREMQFTVRPAGECENLIYQEMYTEKKYLCGYYSIEIPSLPIIRQDSILISQSSTTTVEIPQPGVITIQAAKEGICDIYLDKGNDLEKITHVDTKEGIARIQLMPGNYRIVYRPQYSRRSFYTIEKRFKIESGKSSVLRLL